MIKRDWTLGKVFRDMGSGLKGDIKHADGRHMVLCWSLSSSRAARNNTQQYKDDCDAIARRFIACWNACEGEDTSFLEYMVNEERTTIRKRHDAALELQDTLSRQLTAVEKERDALLVALKDIRRRLANSTASVDGDIEDALSLVEGR
jgi:signal transduction histidine kinase